MLKIDRQEKRFTRLTTPTLSALSILERAHLQEFIFRSSGEFFEELGLDLFMLAREFKPSDTVDDRIDLLAFDRDGRTVVIELKRGNDKLQLLQAIGYAAMVSKWEAEELMAKADDRREELEEFLGDAEEVNGQQRIILVAEAYDYEVLAAAEWLSERYGVDILCSRVALAVDESTRQEYLTCNAVYPAPELAEQAITRRTWRTGGRVRWTNWDEALENIDNSALVAFFKERIQAGQEYYLPKRILHFRLEGKRRWFIAARNRAAYVWQMGRFDKDVEFWQQRVSDPTEVKLTKEATRLRFFLSTADDFATFHRAVEKELVGTTWMDQPSVVEDDE